MYLIRRSKFRRLLPVLAPLLICAGAMAQVQAPTPENPYPMPHMSVDNSPAPAAPTPAPKAAPQPPPQPAPRPAAAPAKPSPTVPAAPKPNVAPARPTPFSLLNTPAEPARVILYSGKLTIQAANSSLSDILGQIAKAGGMKINGLHPNAGQRVFGKYGPGAPREVLSDLLNGSGYNVVMLGVTPAGTPRELALTARAGGLPRPPPRPAYADQDQDVENEVPQADTDNSQEDYQQSDQPFEREEPSSDQPQPPPQSQPQSENQNNVRSPQQILQELKRMHQQQRQQPRL